MAAGFLCIPAAGYLTSPRGALGPTVLQAESVIGAAVAVVVCMGLATMVAALVGRFTNAVVGLFVLGGGLYALVHRTATVEELARSEQSLGLVVVETVLWALLVLAAVVVVFRLAGPLKDVQLEKSGRRPSAFLSAAAGKSALAGLLVLPAVWFIAQSPMKGQVVGAVFVGGLVAGLAGRLWSPHVQPILLFVSPIVFGAIGHIVGMVLMKESLGEAFVAGEVPALCLPMPADYAAGTLLGVSLGLGWAKSFLHPHEEEAKEPQSGAAVQST
ncbi:MAG: hypothetical protein JSV91_15630 [Phycisphaerales bacterium]|nr:MAG: hypothetical protein JSV91_15630 [Phycisphaerales bacterium]